MTMTKYGTEFTHITDDFNKTRCGKTVDASIKVAPYSADLKDSKDICPGCLRKKGKKK